MAFCSEKKLNILISTIVRYEWSHYRFAEETST